MKVLILCTGNSCRSQMAHGFLQSFDSNLQVFSAGTQASGKVNSNAIEVMKDAGIDISDHTSDSVDKYINEVWDYVITVCRGANENCPAFTGKVKYRIHIGFDDPSEAVGTPEFIQSEYLRVRDEIKNAFYNFYTNQIKKNRNLNTMKKIEIFDPTMCCSTGVCGPSVDTNLLRMATATDSLKKQGANIIRHNLKDEPQVYVDNKAINGQLMKHGIDILPITMLDGEIVLTKAYPSNEQLEEWTGIAIQQL